MSTSYRGPDVDALAAFDPDIASAHLGSFEPQRAAG